MKQDKIEEGGMDPLIEEIRSIRRQISDAHGNDVLRLGKRLKEIQNRYAGRLISRPAGARSPRATKEP